MKPTSNDQRLIEDYLPIRAISAEASREKSVRKGHISTLHLWWARRPLVACRAAVYGVLVPIARFRPANGPEEKRDSLARANAAKFVERLCKYPGDAQAITEAHQHILEAHVERLSRETGDAVTIEDLLRGRAPRPKVLDMFAGGGSIPLEAVRLGCEAYAVDLNPVAYIIELCTLVYPQKYGEPEKGTRGSAEDGTWAGLAAEVQHWGRWVLAQVSAEIGDLYPLVQDPKFKGDRPPAQATFWHETSRRKVPSAYLKPLAYLWTRTVRCKKPSCGSTVPLVRQTWLCRKKDRYIALKMLASNNAKQVRFHVVESPTEEGLSFDPAAFSKGGNATCPFCGTTADSDYVKAEGSAGRIGHQMMVVVCKSAGEGGKCYLDPLPEWERPLLGQDLHQRAEETARRLGVVVPNEPLEANPRSFDVQHFGFRKWRDVFTPRQLIAMVAFTGQVHRAYSEMLRSGYDGERAKAVVTCLSMVLGRLADYCTSFCTWQPEFVAHTFDSPGMPMIMDYAEANPIADASGSWSSAVSYVASALSGFAAVSTSATVLRGSALTHSWEDEKFDAVVTDPPYYDSRSYSNLSDHFYVWHKQSIGHLYPEHFASELTPKKSEAIAAAYRHGGVREQADAAYESMMREAFEKARALLKPGAPMVCVYAHKTTAGWATLINSLRLAGFTVVEAWPVEMERKTRQNAQDTGALASSILLAARRREGEGTGSYEVEVRPQLEEIVRERVASLWEMGVSGADLVVAAVGAGLRAFTRFRRVEYANGEDVPTERFLAEVEGVVLETLLEKIFNVPRSGVAAVDGQSRFYVLWRYTYKAAELDSGEAIVFTYGQGVELDGPRGLSSGSLALVEKRKGKYRLRDFSGRGADERLGMPTDGAPAPLVDALHRILWLAENEPRTLSKFLSETRPDRERLRLVAQALAGAGLKGKADETQPLVTTTPSEQAALGRLLANWRSLIEASAMPLYDRTGET